LQLRLCAELRIILIAAHVSHFLSPSLDSHSSAWIQL
jgi:hypothetical protein